MTDEGPGTLRRDPGGRSTSLPPGRRRGGTGGCTPGQRICQPQLWSSSRQEGSAGTGSGPQGPGVAQAERHRCRPKLRGQWKWKPRALASWHRRGISTGGRQRHGGSRRQQGNPLCALVGAPKQIRSSSGLTSSLGLLLPWGNVCVHILPFYKIVSHEVIRTPSPNDMVCGTSLDVLVPSTQKSVFSTPL